MLAIRFVDYEIPEDLRESVERRLFVSSEPEQEGTWHWITGRALEYRPKEYWQPNTQVTVRLGLGGLPLGEGRYGEFDQSTTFSIDAETRLLEADDETKQLRAYQDDAIVQTIPISLGAREIEGNDARSFSGHMIIMSREEESTFVSDLYDYETDVKWAMRLTFSGQFIHGALGRGPPRQRERLARLHQRQRRDGRMDLQLRPLGRPGHRQEHRPRPPAGRRLHELGRALRGAELLPRPGPGRVTHTGSSERTFGSAA
ncbi:hypothetical protein GCM10029992_59090 [Glycomyces albus]